MDTARKRYGEKIPLSVGIDKRLPAKQAWQKTEHDLQKAFFRKVMELANEHPALRDDLWLAHAIPNGGKRSMSEAAAFVAEGVKSGVPDVFVPLPNRFFHGLYIEFKKAGGSPSEEQRFFLNKLQSKGYQCYVVNDLDTAFRLFETYISQ